MTERRDAVSLDFEGNHTWTDAEKHALDQVIELVNKIRGVQVPGVPHARAPDTSAAGLARGVFGPKGDDVPERRRMANLATAYILDKRLNAMSAAGTLGLVRDHARSPTAQLIAQIPGEQRGSDTMASMLYPLMLMEVTRPKELYRGPPRTDLAFGTRVLVLLTQWYNYVGSTILVWIDNSGESTAAVKASVNADGFSPPGVGHIEYEHFTPGSFQALDQRAGAEYHWVFARDWALAPDQWRGP